MLHQKPKFTKEGYKMKNIQLQKLVITNFKGIQSADIPFSHETFIYGANGTGKTTIADAFMWLLFGKNSEEKKDFSIKPIVTPEGYVSASKTENEVVGYFLVDGKPEVLKRINREKWVKPRGESEEKFTGNETLFFWNDVPCQAGEYARKVSELVDEKLFKLITSPYAFASLNWTERRAIITKIVGDVRDEDIAASRKEFQELMTILSGKSLEEFKKEVAAKKKKLVDELVLIPARIDELNRSKPEAPDADLIQIDINNAETEISKCNDLIKDTSKASEQFFKDRALRNTRIGEINGILFNKVESEKSKIRSSYSEINQSRQVLENEIRKISREIQNAEADIQLKGEKARSLELDVKSLREQWIKVNSETLTFNDSEFCCPTCKRSYDVQDIEAKQTEMTDNFNRNKTERLSKINNNGKTAAAEKTAINSQIEELKESITIQKEILDGKMNELKSIEPAPEEYDINIQAQKNALADPEYKSLSDELDRLKQVNDLPFVETGDTSKFESERKQWELKRDALKAKLGNQAVIDRTNKRIEELQADSRSFSQQIADLERQIFTAESFEKAKSDMVEDRVNELFKVVRFRMFNKQINGGIAPDCEILINGVPFSDANTASQINAGIEIINILCQNYEVSAPIIIDGRESVTEIIPTQSQIVNLVVSPEHKLLTVK